LEINVKASAFNMECVEYFAKMEKLMVLHVYLDYKTRFEDVDPELPTLLAHAAGQLPSLAEFSFEIEADRYKYSAPFVENFGRLYPGRKLLLAKLE